MILDIIGYCYFCVVGTFYLSSLFCYYFKCSLKVKLMHVTYIILQELNFCYYCTTKGNDVKKIHVLYILQIMQKNPATRRRMQTTFEPDFGMLIFFGIDSMCLTSCFILQDGKTPQQRILSDQRVLTTMKDHN